jgi:FtsH-binding integral membrane protein
LTVGFGHAACATLLKNAASTYATFPSLQPPRLACDLTLPALVQVPLVILGVLAPFGMGLATAWLVRSRDRWDRVSAALTTALTAAAAAYVLWIGWAVTLAMVVVPSIADLTLLGNAARAPVGAPGHPSDPLVRQYPDLSDAPPDERGGRFFAKIVADQVVGSASGVGLGIAFALATVGLIGFCGTLAGSRLLRRGGSWRSVLVPYFELTVSTSVASGALVSALLGLRDSMSGFGAVALAAVTTLVVVGVVSRWHWVPRVAAAVAWVLVLSGAGLDDRMPESVARTADAAYVILAGLLFRQWYLSRRRPLVAPV